MIRGIEKCLSLISLHISRFAFSSVYTSLMPRVAIAANACIFEFIVSKIYRRDLPKSY